MCLIIRFISSNNQVDLKIKQNKRKVRQTKEYVLKMYSNYEKGKNMSVKPVKPEISFIQKQKI